MYGEGLVGQFVLGTKTAAADTAIVGFIPPRDKAFTRLVYVLYSCSETAHVLRFMKCLGRTTLSAAAAASQAVVNLTAQPTYNGRASIAGDVAGSDFLVIELQDGSYHVGLVDSVDGLEITLADTLAVAARAGAKVWTFGAITNAGHAQHTVVAAESMAVNVGRPTNEYKHPAGLFGSDGIDEPLLLYSNNETDAGSIENARAEYYKAG